MNRRLVMVSGWVCLFVSMAWAQDIDTVRAEIEKQNAVLLSALKAGDAEAYASVFDESGFQMAPGGVPIVEGRDRILRQRRADFRQIRIRDGEIVMEKVNASGDLAYEVGRFRYELVGNETGAVQEIKGRYLVIWRRQQDGRWLIQADVGLPD